MKNYNNFIFESAIAKHAEAELKLMGMFENDEDDGGSMNKTIAKCIMDLIDTFGSQQHSGFTAEYVRDIFGKLSNWENLSELTSDPEEWNDVSYFSDDAKNTLWQNKRNSAVFSADEGKTWYNVNESVKKAILELV